LIRRQPHEDRRCQRAVAGRLPEPAHYYRAGPLWQAGPAILPRRFVGL